MRSFTPPWALHQRTSIVLGVLALLILAAGIPGVGAAREPGRPVSVGSFRTVPVGSGGLTSPVTARPPDMLIVDPARGSGRDADPGAGGRPQVDIPESPVIVERTAGAGGTAVYLGDSYTSGWAGAGIGARGWPRLVGAEIGWRTVNLAVPGTGFLNPGWTGQPIGTRLAAAIAARPDVVVIAGGHNDSRWSAEATASAADRVLDRLHAALPDALLVVVAPIWQDGSPPARCRVLRDRLRAKAASLDAVFIDPLADAWFAGGSHRFIGRDGIHPTNAGHRFIADRVLAALVEPGS